MWHIIAKKEIRQAWRDKLFLTLAAITWLLLLVAAIGGYARYQQAQQQQRMASDQLRQEWEHQEANPHSAAHFGTWLFKPLTFLTVYDNGLNNYTGISYRVEAHKQHEVNHSNIQDTDSQLRFGELSIALVCQLLVPLLIVLLAYGSITREREQNTLRLLRIQGGSHAALLAGKIAGNYAMIVLILSPALLLLAAGAWIFQQPDLFTRAGTFVVAYLGYFLLITILTVIISAWSKSSSGSLFINLGAWVWCAVLLPRIAANWADQAAPLPSRHAFNLQLQEGYSKGLGNDGAVMDRRKRFEQQVLQQYKVDSIQQLPVNFDGLSMQYGEDYSALVYQQVAATTDSLIRCQQHLLENAAWANPFIALQQLSMGLTATDYFHHLGFHQQARVYRDAFIRTLNLDLAKNGGNYGSYDYKVGPAFFRNTQDFRYRLPSTSNAIATHGRAWLALIAWLGIACLLIPFTAQKLAY
ncbi:DUF3526 domain-containing protein [Paraflavitalea pollutisoli]|uniref:DUF3526 domain-containing protein n=1 Tax=Paraflavitalea pollutisoli TaxID=3034143 RepID=UPI0023EBE84C|nr:DUF3526 domain-containing protein [Paraflavitalea sp. H1-2-19X]